MEPLKKTTSKKIEIAPQKKIDVSQLVASYETHNSSNSIPTEMSPIAQMILNDSIITSKTEKKPKKEEKTKSTKIDATDNSDRDEADGDLMFAMDP
ncbi:MAG: hypothetical protein HON78_05500 [Legionellales bacterium]|jgi:hypothetical protein|nr:hypothetical protein [Legionellales bacterium]